MSLPSLQNFTLKWLSLNFSAKQNKSSTRALDTSVVPIITDSSCVNLFFSVSQAYLLAINYSKLENTSGRIENIFQKGISAIIMSTYKILKQMWQYVESKWKLPRLSGISFFTFASCISSLPAPPHERIFRDMEGLWNKLCTGNLPLTQDLMCCVENPTSSKASRIFSIVIFFFFFYNELFPKIFLLVMIFSSFCFFLRFFFSLKLERKIPQESRLDCCQQCYSSSVAKWEKEREWNKKRKKATVLDLKAN